MNPVRTSWTELVYRGPTPDIGDLWCHRERAGEIWSVWEPDEEERKLLAAGGRIRLIVANEPIPPLAMDVLSAEESAPVGEHPYKVIGELDDPERSAS